jgi:hypothetical protein
MATATKTPSGYFSGFRLSAWAAHAASYVTTYLLCAWVADPQTDTGRAIVIVLAAILEFLILHKMKKLLFDDKQGNDALGWAGFVIDSIINAGGVFPYMGRLAAWPPLARLVGALGLDITKGAGNTVAAFIIALIVGIILSVLPIRLDQRAARQSGARSDD